ncbi:MAG: discoidin domain-containing protein, partial [Sedimentisphaerales bacterium]|nr:discoidin domain-containing protein [Sedimentisphaerales bacterium]
VAFVITGTQWKLCVNGTWEQWTQSPVPNISTYPLAIGNSPAGARPLLGMIDDVHVYATALTEQEIQKVMEGPPPRGLAFEPIPDDGATDVSRNVTLSWTPGAFAPATNGHIVYFGESFDDVSAGMGGVRQSAASYTPSQPLDFETTYYWRVDEVNAPPDSTVYEGRVWSFTTELAAYPIAPENIIATASSDDAFKGPQNAVDGSGLDETGLLHGNDGQTMWLSNRIGVQPTWIEFEFDAPYRLHEMWVWNSNESVEPMVGMGIKNATIEYSIDGIDYTTLGTTHEFTQAPGTPGYAHNTTIDMIGVTAKHVRITANDNWKGLLPQYGLSEVRFFYTPVQANNPYPASGATDVPLGPTGNPDGVTLSFAPGREAATHNLYFSTDEQAVIDGTAEVTVLTQATYGPLSLDLDTTYYWRVDEVNDAETPSTWQGPLWSFTTQEYFVLDDFESYNDLNTDEPESNRIFNVWIDGFGIPTNGSLVGYDNPPFVEETIVHAGEQSMPFFYNNISGATYSEAELTLSPAQDWTAAGAKTLSLWFYGDPDNTAAQLYVKVNGVKVAYEAADDLTMVSWRPWRIDLASLGTNVQNVTKLAIGIDGNGAVGRLFIDDITLSPHERQLVTPTEPDVAGLVAHYNLDQDAGDSSGNNIHGTVVGSPTWVAGNTGGAIQLDGRNDYIDCGNDPILDINTPITISAWIYPTGAGISMFPRILDKSDSTDGAVPGYKVYLRAEQNFIVTLSAGGAYLSTVSSVTLDAWNYVAFTVTGEQWRFYANGSWEQWTDSTLPSSATSPLFIGNSPVADRHFYGMIDEVRIYERALTPAEIAWLGGRTEPFDHPF